MPHIVDKMVQVKKKSQMFLITIKKDLLIVIKKIVLRKCKLKPNIISFADPILTVKLYPV